jgi:3'-phosphoadenosine 5'-phosphosulfate sulfotransferase (PAPS reductase)/FAD synthetase
LLDASRLDGHERVALCFSGGKDSLALVYMLRDHLDRITIYHNDTGDLLPEVREIVEHVKGFAPHFVHIHTDVGAWIAANGLPSDLVPFTSHPFARVVGHDEPLISSRYECCFQNLMLPLWQRIAADGVTLVIRGTKRGDFPRLPVESGGQMEGAAFWFPLQEWTHEEVFAYLRSVGAPICRVYERGLQAPECARCTAWMSVGLAAYLRQYHPLLFDDYRARMSAVVDAVAGPLDSILAEVKELST